MTGCRGAKRAVPPIPMVDRSAVIAVIDRNHNMANPIVVAGEFDVGKLVDLDVEIDAKFVDAADPHWFAKVYRFDNDVPGPMNGGGDLGTGTLSQGKFRFKGTVGRMGRPGWYLVQLAPYTEKPLAAMIFEVK